MDQSETKVGRGIKGWVFLGSLLGAVLGGMLIAPPVFNALLRLGRSVEGWEGLRNLEFDSVVGRCVILCLVLSLYPAMRVAGMRNAGALGLTPCKNKFQLWYIGVGLGVLSLLAVVLIGWATGAYYWHADDKIKSVGKVLSIVAGAIAVGFFEEMLFRGLLFGGLRRNIGLWAAAIVSSLLFMLVHFARPVAPITPTFGHWDAGLKMFQHMFYTGHVTSHYFPFMLTLFLMGVVLCLVYERHQNILMAVGLHTGWVLVIRLSGYLYNRNGEQYPVLFSDSELISKTYLSLFVAIGFLVFYIKRVRTP